MDPPTRPSGVTPGGYSTDALFEDLELVRTIRAAGGREARADDLFVRRLLYTAQHVLRQPVRQAYDSVAQPARLLAELAVLSSARGGVRYTGGRMRLAAHSERQVRRRVPAIRRPDGPQEPPPVGRWIADVRPQPR